MTTSCSIALHVKLSTTLRDHVPEYVPARGLEVLLPVSEAGAATVEDLARHIGLPLAEIKIVMRNGVHAALGDRISNGDRIAFFPAVGGG